MPKGLGKKGRFAKHDLDKVPDCVRRILGPSGTTQPAIDEQLKQIESERPKQQDRPQSIIRVMKNMAQVPILNPLIKGGVFDVPARPDDP